MGIPMKTHVDLNSDMGENFGPWRMGDDVDELIMPLISSANIATGFHAGDPSIMQRMVELAKQHKVGIGAHPGFNDLVGFGRRHLNAGTAELVNEFVYQMGALREFCTLHGTVLQHVKRMAGAWADLVEQRANTALDSSRWLLEHLLQAEGTDRTMRSVSHQMHSAKFPAHRDLAGFDFEASPVDRKLVHQLVDLSFTEKAHNAVLVGGPEYAT